MLKVLVVGQTPPPYGGQAVMIEKFVNTKYTDVKLIHVRMGFSEQMKDVGRVRLSKVTHLISIIAQIIYHRIVDRPKVLYYPPGGPDKVPMIRDVVILLCTRWMFSKTIMHFHAGGVSELYPTLPRWGKWLFRKAFFNADGAVRISELNPEDAKAMHARREFLITNGIYDPWPQGPPTHEYPAISAERPFRILYVGILCESKGILVLVEACAHLKAKGLPFCLQVMGQPHDEGFLARVKARIAELGLEDDIEFLGVLTGQNKFDAYAHADVFCMPTFFNCETFGLVFVEAMASELAVVATRWRGVPSIVEDGETGFLVETHNAPAVADRLHELALDPQLRERMAIAGRAKFVREYTWPIHAERMRQALLEVAGIKPSTTTSVIPEMHSPKSREFVNASSSANHFDEAITNERTH